MDKTAIEKNRKVAAWLLILCGLVYAMVILGGITRLTGSGLSMVEWRPVMGVLPPLSDRDWQQTFERYQTSPEFAKVHPNMDIHDFKGIFWLEYLHRLLGRALGIVFFVPFLYFLRRGYIEKREWPRYALMFVLGGLQGALGWYMVKSGLIDDPRVSQYRLTAHLIAAFTIYAYMLWLALSLLNRHRSTVRHPWFGRTVALTALLAITIVSGGFVAGLDAGLIYNTFPMMGKFWVPPDVVALEPVWRNFFENRATVQFDHRVLALTTFCVIVAYWWFARYANMPPAARRRVHVLLGIAVLQVTLGISTLLLVVPIPLAAGHQAVALALFTAALCLDHGLRYA